jgi:hypothetical protein
LNHIIISFPFVPAKAGIQTFEHSRVALDARFRGHERRSGQPYREFSSGGMATHLGHLYLEHPRAR